MNSFNVTELKSDALFTKDLVIDKSFILLPASIPCSEKMKQALLEWEFRQIFSEGATTTSQIAAAVIQPDDNISKKLETKTVEVENEFQNVEMEESFSSDTGTVMQRAIQRVEGNKSKSTSIDNNQIILVKTVYDEYMKFIESVYSLYVTHRELKYEKIADAIKDLCVFVNDHGRYILRLQPETQDDGRKYLVNHAMRSTILAISIALQIRMPIVKQVELGVACLMHEIGMIKLPPQVYMTNRMLTLQEKKSIYTHPLLSYNILKEYSFPLSVCLGVLEHHEQEDGGGYPRKLPSEKISLYAKIIAVACSFEAITAPRFHKIPLNPYDAMVEMLKNNGKQFDETIIKALLFAVSLYPIGAYVFLHNGKIGQVIDVNPSNPKQPIVQLLDEKDSRGDSVIVQTGTEIRIVRTLSRQEVADLQKNVQSKSASSKEDSDQDLEQL